MDGRTPAPPKTPTLVSDDSPVNTNKYLISHLVKVVRTDFVHPLPFSALLRLQFQMLRGHAPHRLVAAQGLQAQRVRLGPRALAKGRTHGFHFVVVLCLFLLFFLGEGGAGLPYLGIGPCMNPWVSMLDSLGAGFP